MPACRRLNATASFNEARASLPGKGASKFSLGAKARSFNEARASLPGKELAMRVLSR